MTPPRKVLILGADGFIGRHLAFALRDAGWEVTAQARTPARFAAMGFATLNADLTDPATHSPAFWAPHLPDGTALVYAAGLLTGTEASFAAVHRDAPNAALQALSGFGAVLVWEPSGLWEREEALAVASDFNAVVACDPLQTEPEEKLSSSRQIMGQTYRPLYERLRWMRFLSCPSSSTTSKLPDMAMMS